jgi:hypothetical protein
MAVWKRWIGACTLTCTAWSLPFPLGPLFLLLGGVLMALAMRAATPRAWRLAWSMPVALAILVPVAIVCAAALFPSADGVGAFVVAGVVGGASIGTSHALVFADWERWWWWVVGGAVTGPSISLVFVSWGISVPLGFVPGALYGLATCIPAELAIGRARGIHP